MKGCLKLGLLPHPPSRRIFHLDPASGWSGAGRVAGLRTLSWKRAERCRERSWEQVEMAAFGRQTARLGAVRVHHRRLAPVAAVDFDSEPHSLSLRLPGLLPIRVPVLIEVLDPRLPLGPRPREGVILWEGWALPAFWEEKHGGLPYPLNREGELRSWVSPSLKRSESCSWKTRS